eukprot:NODE_15378_length_1053_cov_2.942765.p1 GENE.NODE_15378_length_1053_cov_2.942765~~NODE_15378_length_1053_cov_2.942765.p1  ORF type:complete len:294 (-),score=92.50 NODE_15378_length_1053_cov_2.942765:105-986(-)
MASRRAALLLRCAPCPQAAAASALRSQHRPPPQVRSAATASKRDVAADGTSSGGFEAVRVQRWAVPSGAPQIKARRERRRVKSVAQLHIEYCEALIDSPRGWDGKAADVTWDWAARRACKLAEIMNPRELALCAATFARAGRRDMRLFFMLAQEAIERRASFSAAAAARMSAAYARVRIRNEPLFEKFGARVARLAADDDTGADAAARAGGRPSAKVLAVLVLAHAELSLLDLPAYPALAAALAPIAHKLDAELRAEALRALLTAGANPGSPDDCHGVAAALEAAAEESDAEY